MPAQLPQRRLSAQLLLALCMLGLLSCLVAAGYSWASRQSTYRQLNAVFEDELSNTALMEKRHRESTSRQGTIAWSKIVELCESNVSPLASSVPIIGQGPQPIFGSSEQKSWPNIELTEQYLAEMQPVLELIRESRDVEMPVWMEMQFDGVNTLLHELQASRSISSLVQLEAFYALYVEDAPRALDAFRSLDAVPKAFDWHLYLVGELIHTALRGMFYDAVQQSLKANLWSVEQLAELRSMMAEPIDLQHRWEQTLMAEQTFAYERVPELSMQNTLVSAEDRLALVDDYQQAIELGKNPIGQLSDQASKLEENLFSPSRRGPSPGYVALRSSIFPAIAASATALECLEYTRRLTVTALAIKQFELANERWPQDLSELHASEFSTGDWLRSDANWWKYLVLDGNVSLDCPRARIQGVTSTEADPVVTIVGR